MVRYTSILVVFKYLLLIYGILCRTGGQCIAARERHRPWIPSERALLWVGKCMYSSLYLPSLDISSSQINSLNTCPVICLQFGNTCYCNSVLQALFFCRPFREKVLAYKPSSKRKETLLTCLTDLFNNISSQKKKVGVIAPKKFVARLRKENGKTTNKKSCLILIFPNTVHELNYVKLWRSIFYFSVFVFFTCYRFF